MADLQKLELVKGWSKQTHPKTGVSYLCKKEPGLELHIQMWSSAADGRSRYRFDVVRSRALRAFGYVFEQADAVFACNLMASVYADIEEQDGGVPGDDG